MYLNFVYNINNCIRQCGKLIIVEHDLFDGNNGNMGISDELNICIPSYVDKNII